MNKYYVHFLLLITCMGCHISCKEKTHPIDQSIIEFDVTKKYPLKVFDIHDLADVEYLILESKDSFLFTNFVYLTDNYIVALNYYEMSFVFFDRKGKPISNISKAGQGPEEYMPFWIQIYCEDEDEFYVFSYPNKIQVYNMEGVYKRTLPLRGKSEGASIDALYNYDDNYLLCHDKEITDSNSFYLLSKKDGTTKDIYMYSSKNIPLNLRKTNDSGQFINFKFDACYAVKNGDNFLLTNHSSDTIFTFTPQHQLLPKLIRKPSIQNMDPPVLVNGFLETNEYLFFSTQKIDYNFNTKESGEAKGYMWDKESGTIHETKTSNRDYIGQKLMVSPVRMISMPTERSFNPNTGVLVLSIDKLSEANAAGKLSGNLKEIVDMKEDEDIFVLMIMKFK